MRLVDVAGLSVSVVGLGTSAFVKQCDAADATRTVHAALDAGVTLFDTADSYGAGRCGAAEETLGRALGRRRRDVIIASKFGTEFAGEAASASPDRARAALEGSLRRLGTDYLDLYLLHVPDVRTPIEDTLAVMGEFVTAGKVRAIGCCNLDASQLEAADRCAPDRGFRWVQDEYNLLSRQVEAAVLPHVVERGKGFIAYAPLAQGVLSGKYVDECLRPVVPPRSRLATLDAMRAQRMMPDRYARAGRAYVRTCRSLGLAPHQFALAWLLSRPGVTSVIPGATSPRQLLENAKAADVAADPDTIAAVEAAIADVLPVQSVQGSAV